MTDIDHTKILVGLEVGTSKVVAVAAEMLPDGVANIIGVGSSPSKGIDKGSIIDLAAVVNSIQRAIENAEAMSWGSEINLKIMTVTLAITGEHIRSINESGFVPITNGTVTQDEVDEAVHIAKSVHLGEGLTLLHAIPQEYEVDRQKNITNPIGLNGHRLKAQAHLIGAHQAWLTNLQKAVEKCNLNVEQTVFSGLASAYSVLTEDEKDLGVCLIDFGGGTMDVMVYTNGELRYSKVIPYGGNTITDYLAQSLTTSRNEAERIKINFGSAVKPEEELRDHYMKKRVEVAGLGGSVPRVFSKAQIVDVTSICYNDLLEVVKQELELLSAELSAKGIKKDLIAGFVLTGGGAQMEDIVKCATNVFGSHVRVGYPLNIKGLTDYVNKPQYATVLGLLQFHHQSEKENIQSGFTMDTEDSLMGKIWNTIKRIGSKVKEEF